MLKKKGAVTRPGLSGAGGSFHVPLQGPHALSDTQLLEQGRLLSKVGGSWDNGDPHFFTESTAPSGGGIPSLRSVSQVASVKSDAEDPGRAGNLMPLASGGREVYAYLSEALVL